MESHSLINNSRYIIFTKSTNSKKNEFKGAFPRAIGHSPKEGNNYKNFNERSIEIRIDSIQHALRAFIQYKQTSKCTQ